jgi:Ca2+-binding RTX toxin-like protein
LVGGTGNDTLTGGAGSDTIRYSSGDGQDRINGFAIGAGGDILSFSGIAAIDVRIVSGNTQFHVGDGIAGNTGFGTGSLLLTLAATTFTQTHISTNIDPTNSPVFQFS